MDDEERLTALRAYFEQHAYDNRLLEFKRHGKALAALFGLPDDYASIQAALKWIEEHVPAAGLSSGTKQVILRDLEKIAAVAALPKPASTPKGLIIMLELWIGRQSLPWTEDNTVAFADRSGLTLDKTREFINTEAAQALIARYTSLRMTAAQPKPKDSQKSSTLLPPMPVIREPGALVFYTALRVLLYLDGFSSQAWVPLAIAEKTAPLRELANMRRGPLSDALGFLRSNVYIETTQQDGERAGSITDKGREFLDRHRQLGLSEDVCQIIMRLQDRAAEDCLPRVLTLLAWIESHRHQIDTGVWRTHDLALFTGSRNAQSFEDDLMRRLVMAKVIHRQRSGRSVPIGTCVSVVGYELLTYLAQSLSRGYELVTRAVITDMPGTGASTAANDAFDSRAHELISDLTGNGDTVQAWSLVYRIYQFLWWFDNIHNRALVVTCVDIRSITGLKDIHNSSKFLDRLLGLWLISGYRRMHWLSAGAYMTPLGRAVLAYLGTLTNAPELREQIAELEVPTHRKYRIHRSRENSLNELLSMYFGRGAGTRFRAIRRWLRLMFWLQEQGGSCPWVEAPHLVKFFASRAPYEVRLSLQNLRQHGLISGDAPDGGQGLALTPAGVEALDTIREELPEDLLRLILHEALMGVSSIQRSMPGFHQRTWRPPPKAISGNVPPSRYVRLRGRKK